MPTSRRRPEVALRRRAEELKVRAEELKQRAEELKQRAAVPLVAMPKSQARFNNHAS